MLVEGFELNLSEREVCKMTKESMHKSVVDVIDNYLGFNIFDKPFYAFYTDISDCKNYQDFNVLAKDYHNYELLIGFAKHLVKIKGIRYDIARIKTSDDERFYIIHEDDFE